MMRHTLLGCFLLASAGLFAQLRVGGDAGEMLLPIRQVDLASDEMSVDRWLALSPADSLFSRAPAPEMSATNAPTVSVFNYNVAKPYLAFFCRLELNIEAATHFPVRFRLGEVRGWQQELSKRD